MDKFTIADFDRLFPDDATCLEWLKNYLYPDGILCQNCKRITKHHRVVSRPSYSCDACGHHVHPTAGTIYHKSPTPLRSWFHAVFLMSSTRTGISAKQLERELGVTYKTAWRMFSQIRKMMAGDAPFLFGKVEADETYIGGKRPGKRGRGAAGKSVAFGMVERESKQAVVKLVPNVQAKTLLPIIAEHIPVKAGTTIYTDELASYKRLTLMGYKHETVQHAAKQYVSGIAHVNNVENLWSNTKRGIDGVHHSVSPQHLQSYLDAYVFRYNHRGDEQPMFTTVLRQTARALSD
jgi:transposase-like protein